jgi:S-adenosylmethionine-diacylgycerolhomoserine-N-methlytransferase
MAAGALADAATEARAQGRVDWRADLRVLASLARGLRGPGSHAERLERFYAPQARDYDGFRRRLLQGREDLIDRLRPRPGARVVELGAGTGVTLEFFGKRLDAARLVTLVDLCPALLAVARERHAKRANVGIELADATTYRPSEPVDLVYFSYSLSMIPDWRAALANAASMLAPGGTLGVVDFQAPAGRIAHSLWTRWFRHDGVRLARPLAELRTNFHPQETLEREAALPFLPGLRIPYFVFVGRARASDGARP